MESLSKPKKVENFILSQISKGVWTPGERLPSDEELSNELGVGCQTVKGVMSRLAHEGVLDRTQRLGTYLSKKNHVSNIGILTRADLLMTPRTGFHAWLLARLMQQIENNGYHSIISGASSVGYETEDIALKARHALMTGGVLGVLSLGSMGLLQNILQKSGIPSLSVCPGITTDKYAVILDYESLLQVGTQELKKHGYDDFVLMYSDVPYLERHIEQTLYHDKLRRNAVGGDLSRLWSCPFSHTYKYAYDAFKDYWLRGKRPRAIFFYEDAVFDIASRAILELGIKVPEELALITAGNKGDEYYFNVPITAVEFDVDEIAKMAWQMLDKLIAGASLENTMVKTSCRIKQGHSL